MSHLLSHPLRHDACCANAARVPLPIAPTRRTRLAELDANIHCSIIGTCLSTGELRKLIPRYAPLLDRKGASDLEIHHTAVELSAQGGVVAKELNKALDTRHALAIKRFRAATDERALKLLWQEALAHGDVPGAYWALMTHPAGTYALRTLAFGDVHMLSHLVGASNRADIRRLAVLDDESARLREQNASLQARLHEASARHESAINALTARLQALRLREEQLQTPEQLLKDVAALRAALADRDEKIGLYALRQRESEDKLRIQSSQHAGLRDELGATREALGAAQQEREVLEETLARALGDDVTAPLLPAILGMRILYVGGRPGSQDAIARLVAAAGGELLVHDGGIEDRRSMLATMLPRAQLVVFPVDCISHAAMHVAKDSCARLGIACHPVRNASIASFVALMQRLQHDDARAAA